MPITLYPYQKRVLEHLLQGYSVILQAPTGAGKTAAALLPFLHAFRHDVNAAFPPQAIYSVPMRVLANQFFAEYRDLTHGLQLRENLHLTIQTGEQPLDPEFRGDLVFATLDQTLSSLLGVPYSLSPSRYNLNVAAVLGSYLIFDEFHLFPYQATRALFHLLRHLRPVTPFVLMTATFSQTLLQALGQALQAEVVLVSDDEARAIAGRGGKPPKRRLFYIQNKPLTDAEALKIVLTAHNTRTLVVLNAVERAQKTYRRLQDLGARPIPFGQWVAEEECRALAESADPTGKARPLVRRLKERLLEESHGAQPWLMLLHSRFSRGHRLLKEALLRALWGPEGLQEAQPSLIVVATQVVEVGLDISAEVLHTELAPAAAVLQRAGRCARYPGEQGRVYIYPVPDKRGNPDYAPYAQNTVERATVEASWEAFQQRNGEEVDFAAEQAIINQAHQAQDEALIRSLEDSAPQVWNDITATITSSETSLRAELIRDTLTSRTVLVYDAPSQTEEPPFGREGFSLHIGSLHSKLRALQELREELGLDWGLRRLQIRSDGDEDTAYLWIDVSTPEDLSGAFLLAVHPRLAAYDAELGFRLAEPSDGAYQSQHITRPRPPQPDYGAYRLECYHEHIASMRQVFATGPWQRRFAWLAGRLSGVLNVPEERLWQALYLTIALHDVGKLQQEWQAWAWDYQKRIGEPLPDNHCLVAHTHSDNTEAHHQAARKARPRKPRHAGEGAYASARLLAQTVGSEEPLVAQAALMAIARHHSPGVEDAQPYRLHGRATEAVARALDALSLPREWSDRLVPQASAPDLAQYLLEPPWEPDDEVWWGWWLYFALVRPLRLIDGMSIETNAAPV